MADFDDICRGLAANLNALAAVNFQVSPYLLDSPNPNTVQIGPPETAEFDVAMRGSGGTLLTDQYEIPIEVCLQRQPDKEWQIKLRKLMAPTGANSLRAAVEADTKLTSRMADDLSVSSGHNPACDDLHVIGFRGITTYTLEDATKVALAVWTVQVLT